MSLARLALVTLMALSSPVLAESQGGQPAAVLSVAELGRILQFDEAFEVLREEGLQQAADLAETMLPRARGPTWDSALAKVYDMRRIRAAFNRALRVQLAQKPDLIADIQDFFASDLGQRVLTLEIEARRAFLDVAQEEAARVAADTPETARDPKWRLIADLIEANDLIEMNVAGGLSGSLAFTLGLQDSGATGEVRPVDDLVAEVWGQEAQLRADMESWLKAYFGLAYSPLTEGELATYLAFLQSPAGQHYSLSLFVAFDVTFRQISQDLGRAVGQVMQARDI